MYKVYRESIEEIKSSELISDFISNNIAAFKNKKIDSFLIKKLPNADVLLQNKENSSGKTSHIAYTTDSMWFFADIIFSNLTTSPEQLKFDGNKTNFQFTVKVIQNLKSDVSINSSTVLFFNHKSNEEISQLGISKVDLDGEAFKRMRENMFPGDFLVWVKVISDENIKLPKLDLYVFLIKSKDYLSKLFGELVGLDENKKIYLHKKINAFTGSYRVEENNESNLTGVKKAKNIIVFGSPGTGKSHLINERYSGDSIIERVTFHPEYTYSDFIGSIRPKISNGGTNVSFEFEPGPFTYMLKKASEDLTNHYVLIIEELNRANAASVFGDVFQLLDRNEIGESRYEVTNFDIAKYVYENSESKIKIPNNLSIVATMNSADQNVFALDSAFKRRWEFEYVSIDFNKCEYKDVNISGLPYTWSHFASRLNNYMINNEELLIEEDKLIGPWYLTELDLKDNNVFLYKLIGYLWNDVFRHDKNLIFNLDLNSFSDLCYRYSENPLEIFNEQFKRQLNS